MMACMNETLTFNKHTQLVTPVGADFGYAEVTLAACDDSPRHQLPPSPSPRFQPSPQPYLQQLPPCSPKPYAQQPPPPSSCKPPPPRPPPPRPSSKLCLPSSSPSSSDPCRFPPPALSSCRPYPQAPPRTNPPQSHPHSPASQSQASVRQDLDESTKELPVGVKEPPQRADLVVKKNVGQDVGGEALTESPAVSCSGTMGDSKENKSPRSSTSENLQTLSLKEHYEIERELGRGTYGKVVLARCRHTGTQVALKLLPKSSTKLRDFQREFQLSYFLSPHSNIIDTYNVAFETKSSFVFAQEHAPLGDLFDAIPPQLGMREADAKSVVKQLASALEFMHSKHLVHRDIKPENVLVMTPDFTRVKLMDFGMTRKHGGMVRKTNGSIPYTPPEVCEAVRNENILVSSSADVWALAVLLFCMLTGNFPWENADIGDVYFKEFVLWQRRKTTKLPSQWRRFTPRAMKYFRKALDVKHERRCEIREIHKYMSDAWTQKPRTNDSEEDSGSSTSCDHMDELATMLQDHGIETRVDRRLRERRISEWLLSL